MLTYRPFAWIITALIAVAFWAAPGFDPSTANAAGDIKRILVVETMPVPAVLTHIRYFVEELAHLGYRDTQNCRIEVLKADGDRARAVSLLRASLQTDKPDLVATFATLATQAAQEVFRDGDVPILFTAVSDPVGAGIIQTVGEATGTHITGRVSTLSRKTKLEMTLQLVKQTIGDRPVRFGLIHSSYPSSRGDVKALVTLADTRNDVRFVPFELAYRKIPIGLQKMLTDVLKSVQVLDSKVDFWWQPNGPLGEVAAYTNLFLTHSSRPIAYGNTLESVRTGALIAVIPNSEAGGRELARLADAVLKGADPGKIPVIAPESFDLGLNLATALRNGIAIPSGMMALAGEKIYH